MGLGFLTDSTITGTLTVSGDATLQSNLYLGDSDKIILGAGSDLEIYHDAANSYINETGTGNMYIQFYERLRFQDYAGGNGIIAQFNTDTDGAQLYYQNALKIQTTNIGVSITGSATISTIASVGSDTDKFLMSNGGLVSFATGAEVLSYIGAGTGSGTMSSWDILSDSGVGAQASVTNTDVVTFTSGDSTLDVTNSGLSVSFNLADTAVTPGSYTAVALTVDQQGRITTISSGSPGDITGVTAGTYLNGGGTSGTVTVNHDTTSRSDTSSSTSPGSAGTFTAIDTVTSNSTGHVTAVNLKTVTMPTVPTVSGVYLPLAGGTMTGVAGVVAPDDFKWNFGTGSDLEIYHDGSEGYIDETGTGDLYIRNSTTDGHIRFYADDSAGGIQQYMRINGAEEVTEFFTPTRLGDGIYALFGNSSDGAIYHSGTDMNMIQYKADGDLSFKNDDGTGVATTTYFWLDGGTVLTRFIKGANFNDNVKLTFGDIAVPGDLEIYHDGSHSYITDTGTGSLILRGTNFQLNNSDNSLNMITATDGGAVTLFENGTGRLATTSTGVTVTGIVTATGGTSTEWNEAYDNMITAFSDSGTSTVTLTLTQQDGGTLTTSFSVPQGTGDGTVTSIAATTDGGALSTSNTVTTSGTLTLPWQGSSSQYVRGDGELATYDEGTVTSVAVTAGTGISISGSPITGSGTITVTNTAPATIDGSGAANKLAIWSDADSLTYDTDLSWTSGTNQLNTTRLSADDIFLDDTAASGALSGYVGIEATQLVTRTAAQVRSDIGAGTGSGSVTSVSLTSDSGTTSAITSSGTFDIEGGTNITTSATGTTVTINTSATTNTGTVTSVTVGAGNYLNGGGTITTSGTATVNHDTTSRSDTSSSTSPGSAGTFTAVDSVTTGSYGHITALNLKTVTMPTSDNYNYWTASDGTATANITSGSTLIFEGGNNITTTKASGKITFAATGLLETSGGTMTGDIVLADDGGIQLDTSLASGASGTIIKIGTGTLTAGTCYMLQSGPSWSPTEVEDEEFSKGLLGIALGTSATTHGMLTNGILYDAAHGFSIGYPLYLTGDAGLLSTTAPTASGSLVRVVGYAIDTDEIYFCPDPTWVLID